MEGGRVLFDASSYMLFEASGDSEAELLDRPVAAAAPPAEDDAQSCSCGHLSDYTAAIHDEIDAAEDDLIIDECVEKVEEDGGGEVEDGVVDQCCGGKAAEMEAGEEEEEDRLFWEACLAS